MEYVTDVAKELEQVVAQLKNKHIRMTPQRRAILSYLTGQALVLRPSIITCLS